MCEITGGYESGCDNTGGVDVVYIFASRGVEATVTNGEVTALALPSGKYAYPFYVEAETANFTVDSVGEKTNKATGYTHTSTVILHGNTKEDILNIDKLNRGRHSLIHQLADGTYELLHYNNGAKSNSSRASGTVYEDMNGTTLTFTSKEKTPSYKIDASLVTAILAPAS